MESSPATTVVSDLSLARRLERAEGLSNAEFVEARAQAFPDCGAEWIDVAGTLAMFDGPDSPCTQTFCLGMGSPVTSAQLDQLEQFFQCRGADVFHEVCPLADESLLKLLNERGYQPFEFSNVLYRSIYDGAISKHASGNSIRVRLAEDGDHDCWAATAARGWHDVAPQLTDFILELATINPLRRNTHCFLAERDDEAIAAGALSVFEGMALFAGACTVPQWRKQGAQKALLEHRLRFGAERGCDFAMIVAGPGSASQRNAERQGFRAAYTRIKWRLDT